MILGLRSTRYWPPKRLRTCGKTAICTTVTLSSGPTDVVGDSWVIFLAVKYHVTSPMLGVRCLLPHRGIHDRTPPMLTVRQMTYRQGMQVLTPLKGVIKSLQWGCHNQHYGSGPSVVCYLAPSNPNWVAATVRLVGHYQLGLLRHGYRYSFLFSPKRRMTRHWERSVEWLNEPQLLNLLFQLNHICHQVINSPRNPVRLLSGLILMHISWYWTWALSNSEHLGCRFYQIGLWIRVWQQNPPSWHQHCCVTTVQQDARVSHCLL